jgi:two-component system, LytTR family, response regulator
LDDFIFIRNGNRILILYKSQVNWIQAKRNGVLFHLSTKTYSVSSDIEYVESKLDPFHFVRVNKSAIVNLNKIRQIETWLRGGYLIWLTDGSRLILTSSYRPKFKELLRFTIG